MEELNDEMFEEDMIRKAKEWREKHEDDDDFLGDDEFYVDDDDFYDELEDELERKDRKSDKILRFLISFGIGVLVGRIIIYPLIKKFAEDWD